MNINDLNSSLGVMNKLNNEQLNSIYAGIANSTTVPQAFRNSFTKQDLLNFVDEADYIFSSISAIRNKRSHRSA